MKILLSAILLLFLFVLTNPAQCETEPTIENTGKILKELKTAKEEKLSSAADYLLTLKASVKGASWQKKKCGSRRFDRFC